MTNRLPRADFNGDGYNDLAVSAPGGWLLKRGTGPAVVVMYGGKEGLNPRHRTVLPDADGSMAQGDLDHDGITDLVVGSAVYWGGPEGLTGKTAFESGQYPVIGDFNGDGRSELAVQIANSASSVRIYAGGFSRKGPRRGEYVLPHDPDLPGDSDGLLDMVLTAGDFTGDGVTDLAVSARSDENRGSFDPPILLYQGSKDGLRRISSKTTGFSVAIGDVDGDGFGDIAANTEGGPVLRITYGSPNGPGKGRRDQVFARGKYLSLSAGQLLLGDVTGDGCADLVLAQVGKQVGTALNAGQVVVLRGSAEGITEAGVQYINQDTPGVPGRSETRDRFATRIRLSDFDNDGRLDLAVSAPEENREDGGVWIFSGTDTGLSTQRVAAYYPADLGVRGGNRVGDQLVG